MNMTSITGADIRSSIDSQYDYNHFNCGQNGINEFLRNNAFKFTNLGITNTTLFTFSKGTKELKKYKGIVGYYSISASVFRIEDIIDKKSVKDLPHYNEFPAIKINFFAIDKRFQNMGVGTAMMLNLFYILYMSQLTTNLGVTAIILDAIDKSKVINFYKKMGFSYIHNNYRYMMPYQQEDIYHTCPMMIRFRDIVKAIEQIHTSLPNLLKINPYNLFQNNN